MNILIDKKKELKNLLKQQRDGFKELSKSNNQNLKEVEKIKKQVDEDNDNLKKKKFINLDKYWSNKKKLIKYEKKINTYKLDKELFDLEKKETKQKIEKINKKVKNKDETKLQEVLTDAINNSNPKRYNHYLHLRQLRDSMKPVKKQLNKYLFAHDVKYYDENNNLVQNIAFKINKSNDYYSDCANASPSEEYNIHLRTLPGFKYHAFDMYAAIPNNNTYYFYDRTKIIREYKDIARIVYDNSYGGSSLIWLPLIWCANNSKNKVVITTKRMKNLNKKNTVNFKLLENQIFRDDDLKICFYTGIVKFLTNKIQQKNRYAKTVLNKIFNNPQYMTEYTMDKIKNFCEEFKLSVHITNLFDKTKDFFINESSFNRLHVQFINTKYNHLDHTFNNYDIDIISKEEYENKKANEKFYIEKYGQLTTIDKVYKKEDTDFNIVFNKWRNKYNLDKLYINENKDSQITDMLSLYEFNMHTFFKEFDNKIDDESNYIEYDIEKAYYNYSNTDLNEHYIGIPSGSFITTKCDSSFTYETFNKQLNNKLIGFYHIKVVGYKKLNKSFEKLGFNINTEHVLFSSTIKMLNYYLEFEFLNASYAPAVHIPFNEEFKKKESGIKTDDGKEIEGIKYYCKAVGIMLRAPDSFIQTTIKPLDNDIEYYKLINDERFNCYYDEDKKLYYINDSKIDKKSYRHIAYTIHSYITTIILEELLNIKNFDDVLGVKFDSLVLKKCSDYEPYNEAIFNQKTCKLNKMFENLFNDDLKYNISVYKNGIQDYQREYIKFETFKINNEYITNKRLYCIGSGGTGKTFNILENFKKSNLLKHVSFSSLSWDLIQQKKKEYPEIIGLSIPKLSGFSDSKKCEKVDNKKIKYIIRDEMTLSNKRDDEIIDNDYYYGYIFYLGDIDKDGRLFQCSINKEFVYKPDINKHQIIEFIKSYRFDDELNERIQTLRKIMINHDDNIKLLLYDFINLFKDRIFNSKDIIFNENDFGISSKNDIKNDSKLTNYFIEKGSKPQYYIKQTNLNKNELRGQRVQVESNNTECKLFKTIHSFQGRQLEKNDNKLIIYLNNIFDYELLYTAISRARRTDQIYLFTNI